MKQVALIESHSKTDFISALNNQLRELQHDNHEIVTISYARNKMDNGSSYYSAIVLYRY